MLESRLREGEWSPSAETEPSLWELFCSADDAAADGLALAFALHLGAFRGKADPAWLWVQDSRSIHFSGRTYIHGLPAHLQSNLLHVAASRPVDALWAMEEGVRCRALSFVIGEIAGNPAALDFTATRRLVLASARSGVPLLLIRRGAERELSAARMRWQVSAGPSEPDAWDTRAPGSPTADAQLFRARAFRPGKFSLAHGVNGDERAGGEAAGDRLHLVPEPRDRAVEEGARAAG